MRRMITFDEDHVRFTNRIVGIAYDGDRVLLHRAITDDFWALPGGRAELLETAAETLRREMREEMNETVEWTGWCGSPRTSLNIGAIVSRNRLYF
jgi:ADP-ribose pyrophosphatase YjhB (NUDIX family)